MGIINSHENLSCSKTSAFMKTYPGLSCAMDQRHQPYKNWSRNTINEMKIISFPQIVDLSKKYFWEAIPSIISRKQLILEGMTPQKCPKLTEFNLWSFRVYKWIPYLWFSWTSLWFPSLNYYSKIKFIYKTVKENHS